MTTQSTPDRAPAVIPPEVISLIAPGRACTISTLRPDGSVSSIPVCPMFDGTRLWLSSRIDTYKVRNLEHDDRLTILLIDPDDLQHYAQIRGRARLIPDEDRSRIDELAKFHMNVDTYPYDNPGQARVTIVMEAEAVTIPAVPRS